MKIKLEIPAIVEMVPSVVAFEKDKASVVMDFLTSEGKIAHRVAHEITNKVSTKISLTGKRGSYAEMFEVLPTETPEALYDFYSELINDNPLRAVVTVCKAFNLWPKADE